MRHPSLHLTIVPSEALPGTLSVRVNPDDRSGTAFRHALTTAGFLAGDRVTLTLEGDQVLAILAKSFFRELRDGVAAADPVAFVARWTSVVAEVDAR
jgi:hypothetical protein